MNSTLGPPRIAPRNDATSPLGLSTTFRDFQNANDAASPTEENDDARIVCKRCNDSGYVFENGGAKRCACVDEERRKRYRAEAGLPYFERRELEPPAREYVANFDKIARSRRNWIAFFGKTGSGKSTQAFGIVDALTTRERPVRAQTLLYGDFVRRLAALRYDAVEFEKSFRKATNAPLLLVDDFLDVVPKANSFEEHVAQALIKRRYETRLPLILTTETTPRRMVAESPCGEALLGRIVEMCDARVTIAEENAVNHRLASLTFNRDVIPY
ncbi:MAG: ATP-binding protein [Thermoguttaceae bacterium]|nr:ATP-binding protein [Thermoguttaceae bacterium]